MSCYDSKLLDSESPVLIFLGNVEYPFIAIFTDLVLLFLLGFHLLAKLNNFMIHNIW